MSNWAIFPPQGPPLLASEGVDLTNTDNPIDFSASAGAKGAWTQMSAATDADYVALMITVQISGDGLLDIGVGAASSEVVVIPDILLSGGRSTMYHNILVPVSIPAGVRLVGRHAGPGINVGWRGIVGADQSPPTKLESMGADVSNDSGTNIDGGGTANTKGSWTELSSATSFDIKSLMVQFDRNKNTAPGAGFFVDIGIGAAASEVVVLSNLWGAMNGTNRICDPARYGWINVDIPAGTRVAARTQCSSTDATDRIIGVCVMGAG